ncbi:MAG: hypothetical protein N4A37_03600 [Prolixibacteraceae bacterium]|nr:hypothetical protein [Prolixibacteraceae bacterium]
MTQTFRHKAFLFLMWCCCFAPFSVMGQESYRLVEGEIHSFSVEEVLGSNYNWLLYSDYSLTTLASSNDAAAFVGPAHFSAVSCVFKKPGDFVLRVNSELGGCTNTRILILKILPNNMTLGFANTNQEACATSIGDPLPLDLTIEKEIEKQSSTYDRYFPLRLSIQVFKDNKDMGVQDIMIDRDDEAMGLNLKINDLDEDHRYSIVLVNAQTSNGLAIRIVEDQKNIDFLQKKRPRAGKIIME